MTTAAVLHDEPITDDDRASGLIFFAEQAIIRWRELDPILPAVIRPLCHPTHVDRGVHEAMFEALVEAVREKQGFDGSPSGWLAGHELSAGDRDWERMDEMLQNDIDMAAFDLVNPGPSCVSCRNRGPRQSWRAADMPHSIYCTAHQAIRGVA